MVGEFLQKAGPPRFENASLGTLLTGFAQVALYISGFLVIFWFSWGVFQYIFAGGNKEGLAKARSRIVWSLVGFIILILAFSLSQFAQTIFPQVNVTPTQIKP